MKRLFNLIFCIFKSEKIFKINKKDIVIFDCVNSKVLLEILPKNQTYVISSRVHLIKKLLVNLTTISFILKNLFSRSIQLNYFISLIMQIQPKFVISTIDNSITFSNLSKYFDNKVKFIALQNGTRGDMYENINDSNKFFYFSNYMGFSNFDLELMKKKNIKIKNFFSVGSIKNSYFRKYIQKKTDKEKKNFDICFVSKKIFENNKRVSTKAAEDSFTLLKLLALYVKKYKKSIVIQSKSKKLNLVEKEFFDTLFAGTNYKIDLLDNELNFHSYKNISSSRIIIGAPSTLLREASVYTNTKILCFSTINKIDKIPFVGLNLLSENSFEKFDERLNLLFSLSYEEYLKKLQSKHNYLMENIDTIEYLREFIKKGS
tara:strand:- start:213 stop:1334 length:1122 start_codon:yes stop_codon:yes gene_type:complete